MNLNQRMAWRNTSLPLNHPDNSPCRPAEQSPRLALTNNNNFQKGSIESSLLNRIYSNKHPNSNKRPPQISVHPDGQKS